MRFWPHLHKSAHKFLVSFNFGVVMAAPLQEVISLQQSIGASVMAWGNVEIRLHIIFQMIVQVGSPRVAHEIWTRLQGFDTHLLVTNDVVKGYMAEKLARDEDDHLKKLFDELGSDWKLLFNRARALAQQRNEIVHATVVEQGNKVCLRPFYPEQRTPLTTADIFARATDFSALSDAFRWFNGGLVLAREQRIKWTGPIPDLVLRLRAESNQTRAKPKVRDRSSPP